jgi:predicted ATPase
MTFNQWADTSTLDLLKHILGTTKKQFILFIGAYRDNEVNADHPLSRLTELKKGQQDHVPPLRQICLKPLDFLNVNQLISDTFHSNPYTTEPLTNIIYKKTRGNPFFISKLLHMLYLKGIFSFVLEKGQWTYDLGEVKAVET